MQVQCSADIFSLSSEGLHFPVPRSADQLGHGSHGAVHAPAPGFEQHHGITAIASFGHTFIQHPQATQSFFSTTA